MLPRYFHPTGEARPLADAPLAEVCDVVRIGDGEHDQAVVRDARGALRLCEVAALPEALERKVHAHELVHGLPRRLLVHTLWLFDLQLVQSPGNPAGLNDPLEAFGRLYGPFGGHAAPTAADGHLSLRRLDLLAGHAAEAEAAFTIETGAAEPERVLHAWLPADREDALARGEGAVLAFRLPPADLGVHGGNEPSVAELLHAELEALRADLIASTPKHALAARELPVADRAAAIAALEAEGYRVQGDVATRRDGLASEVSATLATLFGGKDPLARPVPRQGSVDDFLTLARTTLATIEGWPDARANALRALVRRGEVGRRVGQAPIAAPPPPTAPAPRHILPPGPADWAADFAPGRPATPPPRSKPPPSPRRPKAGPPRATDRPTWMDDFES